MEATAEQRGCSSREIASSIPSSSKNTQKQITHESQLYASQTPTSNLALNSERSTHSQAPLPAVLLYGVPEASGDSDRTKDSQDLSYVRGLFEHLLPANVHVNLWGLYRINNSNRPSLHANKPRPIKLLLATEGDQSMLLENKHKLQSYNPELVFQKDYPLHERLKYKKLQSVLRERIHNGETGLKIRNGEIVKMATRVIWSASMALSGRA